MTRGCVTVRPDALAAEGLNIMQQRKVNGLPVVDAAGVVVGVLNMHDMLRSGVL